VSEKGSFPDLEKAPPKEPKKDKSPQDTVRKVGETALKGAQKK
jgi:hypothetical protein